MFILLLPSTRQWVISAGIEVQGRHDFSHYLLTPPCNLQTRLIGGFSGKGCKQLKF